MEDTPRNRYYTADDVAEYLGLSGASAVRRYARLGVIPSVRLGNKRLFKLEDIDRMLEGNVATGENGGVRRER
jgi:excisionase family DNA binding protein